MFGVNDQKGADIIFSHVRISSSHLFLILVDIMITTPSESSLALTSILRLMLYIAAKNRVIDFVQGLCKTEHGNAVVKSLKEKELVQEAGTDLKPTLKQTLTAYLENISSR